ncbi:MAG: hypothetical protein NVS3B28_29500 [Candidatus Velthaea sp.]
MRIATSTIYEQQTTSIDNLQVNFANIGTQISSGKQFNAPSDDPTRVGQDLSVRTTLANQAQAANNVQSATSELTTTDGALANLTSILQSVRTLGIQGATDTLTSGQRESLANQLDQLLQQTVAIANTDYGGKYIFAGSAPQATPPVVPQGSPISGVKFTGNLETQGQLLYNNQQFALSTTIQQSFNYTSADGSPDVFNVIKTLRDTLAKGQVVDQSATSINQVGQVIYGSNSAAALQNTLGNAPFSVPLAADNAVPPGYSIRINNADAGGVQHVFAYSFTAATKLDDGTPASVVGAINANTAATGLTARFDDKAQRLVLTNAGGGAFYVSDVPSPGATTTANVTTVFALQTQADLPNTISTQLGNIDHVLDVALNARSVVGARINALSQIGNQLNVNIVDNTKVQSNIEDIDVAKAAAQFAQTQTALQAAYATTTKLEGKTLFDYIG